MSAMIIHEMRQLTLPLTIVLDALVHFDRRTNGPLVRGDVVQAEFVFGGSIDDVLEVAIRGIGNNIIEWHRFNRTQLGAAIISYCRAKRIPLPYAGAKSLAFHREGVTFSIENEVNVAPRRTPGSDVAAQARACAKGYEPNALRPSTLHLIVGT